MVWGRYFVDLAVLSSGVCLKCEPHAVRAHKRRNAKAKVAAKAATRAAVEAAAEASRKARVAAKQAAMEAFRRRMPTLLLCQLKCRQAVACDGSGTGGCALALLPNALRRRIDAFHGPRAQSAHPAPN